MFLRVIVCIAVMFMPTQLMAGQGQGDIGVSIVSLRTLDLKTLKKMCKEGKEEIACDLYLEKKIDRKTNKKKSYPVYTANFQ